MDDLPLTLTVPIPTPEPLPRGRHASSTMTGRFQIRVSLLDKQLIEHAADECQISASDFIRWVASYAAVEVLKCTDNFIPPSRFDALSKVDDA